MNVSLYTEFVISNDEEEEEIIELYKHATLFDEFMYDAGNHLALVLYDYYKMVTTACKDMYVSQAAFFIEVDELDQKKGSNSEELKKMG
ncbi:hypothetical protein Peur_045302 [Populus x canadensis]